MTEVPALPEGSIPLPPARFRWVDVFWAAAVALCLALILSGVRTASARHLTDSVHFYNSLAYLVLPFLSAFLLLSRRVEDRHRTLLLGGLSGLVTLGSYTLAAGAAYLGWHSWIRVVGLIQAPVASLWLVPLMCFGLMPLLLLPASFYVIKARSPRFMPLVGITALLLTFSSLQPFLSLIVFGVMWGVDRFRHRKWSAGEPGLTNNGIEPTAHAPYDAESAS